MNVSQNAGLLEKSLGHVNHLVLVVCYLGQLLRFVLRNNLGPVVFGNIESPENDFASSLEFLLSSRQPWSTMSPKSVHSWNVCGSVSALRSTKSNTHVSACFVNRCLSSLSLLPSPPCCCPSFLFFLQCSLFSSSLLSSLPLIYCFPFLSLDRCHHPFFFFPLVVEQNETDM